MRKTVRFEELNTADARKDQGTAGINFTASGRRSKQLVEATQLCKSLGGRPIVKDLDLLLRGPEGDDVVADIGHDSFPVVPPYGPICFDVPGLYILEVSVFRGGGRYALQVWGNTAGLGKGAPAPSSKH